MTPENMLESFPFDSSPDVEYDDWGYPRFDRAVGAKCLRDTLRKFFSSGVFPSPGSALQISKADGLAVSVAPGACIVDGAIGTVLEPMRVVLDDKAPAGKVCYALMLRADDTEAARAVVVRVAKSEAGPDPQPPEPERKPGVYEIRLGHVVVPNGASDLSGAVVTNEKGLAACPYAAPFMEIDASEVVADFRTRAEEELARFGVYIDGKQDEADAALTRLMEFIRKNMDLVQSALDGTTAGHLQGQIDELRESGNIANALDPRYLEMAKPSPDQPDKVAFVAGAVKTRELADAAVTASKLADGCVEMRHVRPIVDAPDGIASSDAVFQALRDLAVVQFNAGMSNAADQHAESAILWEFPEDVVVKSGTYDSGGDLYYSEVAR